MSSRLDNTPNTAGPSGFLPATRRLTDFRTSARANLPAHTGFVASGSATNAGFPASTQTILTIRFLNNGRIVTETTFNLIGSGFRTEEHATAPEQAWTQWVSSFPTIPSTVAANFTLTTVKTGGTWDPGPEGMPSGNLGTSRSFAVIATASAPDSMTEQTVTQTLNFTATIRRADTNAIVAHQAYSVSVTATANPTHPQ